MRSILVAERSRVILLAPKPLIRNLMVRNHLNSFSVVRTGIVKLESLFNNSPGSGNRESADL